MLCQLIAYDASGNVVGTLDHMVARDDNGRVVGLVDFEAHEEAGGRLRDVWQVAQAVGSATWPEWVGARAYDFIVELDPDPVSVRAKIVALRHKKSGHRRVRADIEAAIAERINEKKQKARKDGDAIRNDLRKRGVSEELVGLVDDPEPEPADVRDIVGGPNRPLLLDENGRTRPRPAKSQRPSLPVVRRAQGHPSKAPGGPSDE